MNNINQNITPIKFNTFLLPILIIIFTSCVNPETFVKPTVQPDSTMGYIGGLFLGEGQGFGFGITNIKTNTDYFLPFFNFKFSGQHEEQIHLIQVPVGNYRISYWATYDPLTNETTTKQTISNNHILSVTAGSITFLGKFAVSTKPLRSESFFTTKDGFYIVPQNVTKNEFVSFISKNYPNFKSQPIIF